MNTFDLRQRKGVFRIKSNICNYFFLKKEIFKFYNRNLISLNEKIITHLYIFAFMNEGEAKELNIILNVIDTERIKQKVSQQDLASKIGITRRTYAGWIEKLNSDKKQNIGFVSISKACRVLGIDYAEILKDHNEKSYRAIKENEIEELRDVVLELKKAVELNTDMLKVVNHKQDILGIQLGKVSEKLSQLPISEAQEELKNELKLIERNLKGEDTDSV